MDRAVSDSCPVRVRTGDGGFLPGRFRALTGGFPVRGLPGRGAALGNGGFWNY
ncbi:hypothetical protein GCM10012285_42850 [Streptomyces kronopolitis]|uniref:Uncharacterized protein n=1 Tax=Streptomyces kronopolitis TaxID=1612435 RepID=A0ABQ2JR32_9ACTN|nr:hypothetical protein GCM10012285_42850 [Streptomyces kronopolitis]